MNKVISQHQLLIRVQQKFSKKYKFYQRAPRPAAEGSWKSKIKLKTPHSPFVKVKIIETSRLMVVVVAMVMRGSQ